MNGDLFRLDRLSLAGKVLLTLFLLLVGPGYLAGVANIYFQHRGADLDKSELTLDDLKRTFHGLEKEVSSEVEIKVESQMLDQVQEGGEMRTFLEMGGPPAVRALVPWLEAGAKEADFATPAMVQAGDPSAQQAITNQCVECHHRDGGDMEDLPYAPDADSLAEYALVAVAAKPEGEIPDGTVVETIQLAPTAADHLAHITHAHVLTIPVFTLIVGALFLMTGWGPTVKLMLAPLPMLAVLLDISSWWLARPLEPFIYVIAASGALFGASYALQILGVLASMWLGLPNKPTQERPT